MIDRGNRDGPGVMDLVLLSTQPLKTPLVTSSVEEVQNGQMYMLTMVTSNTRPDGSRGLQIKGNQHRWTAIKTGKAADDFDDNDTKINSNSNNQKAEINIQQSKQTQQQTKKQKLSSRENKETININQSNTNSNKSNGTDAVFLHYIILDGLTSSWREFLALHDLGCKVKLLPEVLSNNIEEMNSTSTPALSTPGASQEDGYYDGKDTGDFTGTG